MEERTKISYIMYLGILWQYKMDECAIRRRIVKKIKVKPKKRLIINNICCALVSYVKQSNILLQLLHKAHIQWSFLKTRK